MAKRKSILAVLALVTALCMSFAMIFALNAKPIKAEGASVQDITLAHTVYRTKPDGTVMDTNSVSLDAYWQKLIDVGCTKYYQNVIWGDNARYITFAFENPFLAEG